MRFEFLLTAVVMIQGCDAMYRLVGRYQRNPEQHCEGKSAYCARIADLIHGRSERVSHVGLEVIHPLNSKQRNAAANL
jgi:hypothetical protein